MGDLVLTLKKRKIGYIWHRVLQQHSRLTLAIEKIIKHDLDVNIDMLIPNIHKDLVEVYQIRDPEIEWTDVLDIINGQNIYMKQHSPEFNDDALITLVSALHLAEYFIMTELTEHCKKLLYPYTERMFYLSIETKYRNSDDYDVARDNEFVGFVSIPQFKLMILAVGMNNVIEYVSNMTLNELRELEPMDQLAQIDTKELVSHITRIGNGEYVYRNGRKNLCDDIYSINIRWYKYPTIASRGTLNSVLSTYIHSSYRKVENLFDNPIGKRTNQQAESTDIIHMINEIKKKEREYWKPYW